MVRLIQTEGNATYSIAVGFVMFANFTAYTLDPQDLTNPLSLVQTPSLPTTGLPVPVDPA